MTLAVLEKIRNLEEQRAQLLDAAKREALDQANEAINILRELGFAYRLVQAGEQQSVAPGRRTSGRRTGIRDEVLSAVKSQPKITRAGLLEVMSLKGDKSGEQSVSNALAALKKAGVIKAVSGEYSAL